MNYKINQSRGNTIDMNPEPLNALPFKEEDSQLNIASVNTNEKQINNSTIKENTKKWKKKIKIFCL